MPVDFKVHSGLVALAAERDGDGPVVVCLHAGVCDRRMWRPLTGLLRGRYRVVAYDRRGFGETPAVDEPRAQVDDLFAVLDHNAAGSPAILLGCSQGGRIAIDAALRSPDRIRALILIAPALSGAPEPDLPPAIQPLADALEAAEKAGDLDQVNRLEAQAWLDGPLQPEGRVAGDLRQLFLEMNGIALKAQPMPTVPEPPPAQDRLHELAAPTLVLWGDLDFPHLQKRGKHIAERVPRAEAHVVEGTAHLPTLEQPERCAALIGPFIDRCRPK